MNCAVLALIALLGTGPAPAGRQAPGFESPEFGFRIRPPDASWSVRETPAPPGADFALVLEPSGSAGVVQARVIVSRHASAADPWAYRERIRGYAAGAEGVTAVEETEAEAAGRNCPALTLIQVKPGIGRFRLKQVYCARGLLLYTLQFHAPVARFEGCEDDFRAILRSFALEAVAAEAQADLELMKLAARCGSELDWAPSWEAAAARARKEGKPVLVYLRSYPGFSMTDDVFAAFFTDTDVLELVAERFIPFRFWLDMDAPFKDPSVYGMSPSTFGQSLLLVSAEGRVLRETFAWKPAVAIHAWLLEGLDEEAGGDRTVPSSAAGRRQEAARCLRRGEYARAGRLLEGDAALEAALLRASLLRRQRRGEAALAELELGRKQAPESRLPAFDLERVRVLLGLGRREEAAAILPELAEAGAPESAEALFTLGAVRLSEGRPDAARRIWKQTVERYGDSRWAWMAAAGLTSTFFDTLAGHPVGWPAEEMLAAQHMPAAEPWSVGRARAAREEAWRYLLRTQRADGSWICPSEIAGRKDRPNHLTLAITALCGESLLRLRQEAEAAAAAARALGFALATRARMRESPPPELFMDHAVWSDAYLLDFLAACRQAGLGDRKVVVAEMNSLVADLGRRQKSGGGWSYYLTSDLDRKENPLDISMSFTTAAVLLGLHRARAAGAAVPESILEQGLRCLERMHNADGTFEYLLDHSREGARRGHGVIGASGRGPVCTLALYRFGRASTDDLRAALDRFAEHRQALARERRKTLMHCGVEGVGSHYVMFDYFTCAETVAALPARERRPYRDMLLGEILGAHNAGGSYLDNPLIGPAFGAAAALRAFEDLVPLPGG